MQYYGGLLAIQVRVRLHPLCHGLIMSHRINHQNAKENALTFLWHASFVSTTHHSSLHSRNSSNIATSIHHSSSIHKKMVTILSTKLKTEQLVDRQTLCPMMM